MLNCVMGRYNRVVDADFINILRKIMKLSQVYAIHQIHTRITFTISSPAAIKFWSKVNGRLNIKLNIVTVYAHSVI